MRYLGKTDKGLRRDHNEDGYFADGRLFIVADGMGGHRAGEVASARAIGVVAEYLERESGRGSPEAILAEAIMRANEVVYEEAKSDPRLSGMGTTFTAALVESGRAVIGHVGDSRAYLWRSGQLTQLTEDHSLVAEMVKLGRIPPEAAFTHPQRNIITKALGVEPVVEVDMATYRLEEGDLLMLCSDGLTAMLRDSEIAAHLARTRNLGELTGLLIAEANARGGVDNITIVLVDAEPDKAEPAERVQISTPASAPLDPPASRLRLRPNRKIMAALMIFILLALGIASGLILYARAHYFYVGMDAEGDVALYQGLRWEPLGIGLSHVVTDSGASARNLPDNELENLKAGAVLSREEAERSFEFFTAEARSHRRVPDVTGMAFGEARTLLAGMTLQAQTPDTALGDTASVASQEPAPDSVVDTGSVVNCRLRSY